MNKNAYKYNEKLYVENLLANNKFSKNETVDLKILAKYYKSKGFTNSQIKDLIVSFCEENIKQFNKDIHFKMINKVVNYIKKDSSNLLVIESIHITDKEFEYVKNYCGDDTEKIIILGLIIQNKINKMVTRNVLDIDVWNNYFGVDDRCKHELKRNCGLKNIKILEVFLHKMFLEGLTEVKAGFKTKLKFIDDIEQSDNTIYELKVLNNFNLVYEKLNGNNKITECQVCGELIRNGKTKSYNYCKECSVEVDRMKSLERWRKKTSII